MLPKRVKLNKWGGEKFENSTQCDDCEKYASVMIFSVPLTTAILKLCSTCLKRAADEVTEAYAEKLYKNKSII